MRITKAQIRKIIKEEKSKLISEANPDGTVSGDEDAASAELMAYAEDQIEDLVRHIQMESDRIGGSFRGPGIRSRALKMIADVIYSSR